MFFEECTNCINLGLPGLLIPFLKKYRSLILTQDIRYFLDLFCGNLSMEAHFFQIGKSLLENTVSGNFILNRLRAIWPKSYQRGGQEKSHQNGDYLKTSNAKKLSSSRNEPTAFGLAVHYSTTWAIPRNWKLIHIACF